MNGKNFNIFLELSLQFYESCKKNKYFAENFPVNCLFWLNSDKSKQSERKYKKIAVCPWAKH